MIHSGLGVAATAVALLAAAEMSLGARPTAHLALVAFLGTLAVYGLDRLVDDTATKAGREAFLARVGRAQGIMSVVAGLAATVIAAGLPRRAILLLGAVVLFSVAHARLRRLPWIKPLYIATAWLGVVVGLPAIVHGASLSSAAFDLAPIGLAIVANVLACDACDREAEAAQIGVRRTWWVARLVAGIGVATALVVTAGPLVPIPLAALLAVVPFRPNEGYAVLVLDGSLLVGGIASVLWQLS